MIFIQLDCGTQHRAKRNTRREQPRQGAGDGRGRHLETNRACSRLSVMTGVPLEHTPEGAGVAVVLKTLREEKIATTVPEEWTAFKLREVASGLLKIPLDEVMLVAAGRRLGEDDDETLADLAWAPLGAVDRCVYAAATAHVILA